MTNEYILKKEGQEWKYEMRIVAWDSNEAIGKDIENEPRIIRNFKMHLDSGEYLVLSDSQLSQLNWGNAPRDKQ